MAKSAVEPATIVQNSNAFCGPRKIVSTVISIDTYRNPNRYQSVLHDALAHLSAKKEATAKLPRQYRCELRNETVCEPIRYCITSSHHRLLTILPFQEPVDLHCDGVQPARTYDEGGMIQEQSSYSISLFLLPNGT